MKDRNINKVAYIIVILGIIILFFGAFFFINKSKIAFKMMNNTQKIVNEVAKLAVFLEIPPELAAVLINICWAAAESALDVKELIDGNRVIFLKKPNEFGMSLKGLTEFDPDMFLARDVPEAEDAQGLSYEDYIRIMLAFLPPNIKILRCMDMMEADIRKTDGNENFRIDACADMVSLEVGITSSFGYFYTMERKYGYF